MANRRTTVSHAHAKRLKQRAGAALGEGIGLGAAGTAGSFVAAQHYLKGNTVRAKIGKHNRMGGGFELHVQTNRNAEQAAKAASNVGKIVKKIKPVAKAVGKVVSKVK